MPAAIVTDKAFPRNPNNHAPTDTLETLDTGLMLRVCELCAEAIAALCAVRAG